ncbi:MAG TPA: PilZ domain-containing protein [Candidatus Acidoferrales bacterium]|nr:PilZ domain-containing protein [Candidatus Acidoferrales bacterium]
MTARLPRMETRTPASTAIRLSLLDRPEAAETITIEDVSRHGARAFSAVPWRQGDRVLVQALKGTFRAHGRVVYCKPIEDAAGRFVVGLEFFSPTGKWEE